MPISRRGFLSYAAGASAIGLAARWPRSAVVSAERPEEPSGCALVDAGQSCTLRESVAGFKSALASLNVGYRVASVESIPGVRTIILPGVIFANESWAASARSHLERGARVLLESGAGFLNPKQFGFERRLIKSSFGFGLHRPVRLWDSADSFRRSPYIDYRWPVAMAVRDFSRIIPVDCARGEAIGCFQGMPVAAKFRVGRGTLVFLGSPMGPHLLASDREARNWFSAFFSYS